MSRSALESAFAVKFDLRWSKHSRELCDSILFLSYFYLECKSQEILTWNMCDVIVLIPILHQQQCVALSNQSILQRFDLTFYLLEFHKICHQNKLTDMVCQTRFYILKEYTLCHRGFGGHGWAIDLCIRNFGLMMVSFNPKLIFIYCSVLQFTRVVLPDFATCLVVMVHSELVVVWHHRGCRSTSRCCVWVYCFHTRVLE